MWKQLRGASFTANQVLGLREQLGAISLLVDDVNRDRFTREVPELVKFERERASLCTPLIISTNKQVNAVSPNIRKRAVVCLVDPTIPDQQVASKEIAHRAHAHITTNLYRAYLKKTSAATPEIAGANQRTTDGPAGPAQNIVDAPAPRDWQLHEERAPGLKPVTNSDRLAV